MGRLRHAFRLSVRAGQAKEYESRHHPIWRELEETLLTHGVATYSIFLDRKTNDLFAYVEFDSEEQWRAIAETDVCRRWWRHMSDIMPTNADGSPVTTELHEVFHLEAEPPAS